MMGSGRGSCREKKKTETREKGKVRERTTRGSKYQWSRKTFVFFFVPLTIDGGKLKINKVEWFSIMFLLQSSNSKQTKNSKKGEHTFFRVWFT